MGVGAGYLDVALRQLQLVVLAADCAGVVHEHRRIVDPLADCLAVAEGYADAKLGGERAQPLDGRRVVRQRDGAYALGVHATVVDVRDDVALQDTLRRKDEVGLRGGRRGLPHQGGQALRVGFQAPLLGHEGDGGGHDGVEHPALGRVVGWGGVAYGGVTRLYEYFK